MRLPADDVAQLHAAELLYSFPLPLPIFPGDGWARSIFSSAVTPRQTDTQLCPCHGAMPPQSARAHRVSECFMAPSFAAIYQRRLTLFSTPILHHPECRSTYAYYSLPATQALSPLFHVPLILFTVDFIGFVNLISTTLSPASDPARRWSPPRVLPLPPCAAG